MNASVVEIYMSLLLREPTEAEIAFWTEVAENSSLEAMEQAILISEEGIAAQSLILPVIGLYQGLLERAPEAAGLEFWTNAIAEGALTFQDLIDEFTGSAEFQLKYPELGTDLSVDELAALFYENLLGRAPDAEGVAFWAELLASGTLTPESFAAAFIRTPETQETIGEQIVEYYADVRDGRIDDPNNEGSLLLVHEEPGESEEPDDGSSGGSPRTFSAEIENGVLTFGGNARGDITASVNDEGQLVFTRQGLSVVIDSEDQAFSSIAGLGNGTAINGNGASDVLALTPEGWNFVGTGLIDAFDFYGAVSASSSILLLSGFNVADITTEIDELDFGSLPEELAEIDSIEGVLALLSTSVDLSIAAAHGAKTSLNPLIERLIGAPEGAGPVVPINIGLPVLISGEANTLTANSDEGFALIGRAALTTTGGTPVIFEDVRDPGDYYIGATERTTNLTSLGVDPDGNALFRVVNTTETEQWVRVQQVGSDTVAEFWLGHGQEAIVNVGPKGGSGTTKAMIGGETITKAAGPQLAYGGNDTISGGDGDDIIIGLGDAGQVDVGPPMVRLVEEIDGAASPVENVASGDVLTGGEGSDLFAYLQGDGVDLITDFDLAKDKIAVLGAFEVEIFEGLSLDAVGEGDDSFIVFFNEWGYVQGAGIGVLGVSDAEALEGAILDLYDLGAPEDVLLFGGIAQAPLEYQVL